jgi:hypothetical protein
MLPDSQVWEGVRGNYNECDNFISQRQAEVQSV